MAPVQVAEPRTLPMQLGAAHDELRAALEARTEDDLQVEGDPALAARLKEFVPGP